MPARILLNGRVLIAFVMFAIFVAMVAVALGYPAQARFMPLVVGVPGIAFTLLELIREVRHAARATDAEVAEENSERIALPEEVSRLIGTGAIDVPAETEHFTPDELQRRLGAGHVGTGRRGGAARVFAVGDHRAGAVDPEA